VVAVVAVLGLIYFLKLVLDHDPARAARSLIAVLLMLTLIGGLSYFFFNRVVDFANDLPNYSSKIRETASKVCSQTSKIEERTRFGGHSSSEEASEGSPGQNSRAPRRIESPLGRRQYAHGGFAGHQLCPIPGLLHAHLERPCSLCYRALVSEGGHRLLAHRPIGRISNMIRGFLVGNLLVGLVNAGISVLVFWFLGIKYFYFSGVISGFASLIVSRSLCRPPASSGGGGSVK